MHQRATTASGKARRRPWTSDFPGLLYRLCDRVSPAARRWRGGRLVATRPDRGTDWRCDLCGAKPGGLTETAEHLAGHGVYALHVDVWASEIRTGYRGDMLPDPKDGDGRRAGSERA